MRYTLISFFITYFITSCNSVNTENQLLDRIKKETSEQDSVSVKTLNKLFYSNDTESINYWLEILSTKKIPSDYRFNSTFHQFEEIIKSDKVLPNLLSFLNENKNPSNTFFLTKHIIHRNDIESQKVLIKLLNDQSSYTRFWTAVSLKKYSSEKIAAEAAKLIKQEKLRTSALTSILIFNSIDTLQSTFEPIYLNSPDNNWNMSALRYLSNFPLKSNIEIFKKILNDKKNSDLNNYSNVEKLRYATIGLGKLKDSLSIDLIIKTCNRIYNKDQQELYHYYEALSLIKGDKSKNYLIKMGNKGPISTNIYLKNW